MDNFVIDWLNLERSNHSRRLHELKQELVAWRSEVRGRDPLPPMPLAALPVGLERMGSSAPVLRRQVSDR